MFRLRSMTVALLAGLGLSVGCTNMPIGNGQVWNRMTGKCGCETCPTCDCPCSGTCGYSGPIETPGVLTSGGPALPVQMAPGGPVLTTEMPNAVIPPTQPPIQQAQPMPATPQSRVTR